MECKAPSIHHIYLIVEKTACLSVSPQVLGYSSEKKKKTTVVIESGKPREHT